MIEHNRVTFTDPSGAVKTQHGKAVTVWRRQPDGTCIVDTWNNNPNERAVQRRHRTMSSSASACLRGRAPPIASAAGRSSSHSDEPV
jgi:hypothetical protein